MELPFDRRDEARQRFFIAAPPRQEQARYIGKRSSNAQILRLLPLFLGFRRVSRLRARGGRRRGPVPSQSRSFVSRSPSMARLLQDPMPRIPRVRAENPLLSAAIARGAERSPTFRRLIEAIDATDGLVYVLEGRCGQGVRACLHMSLELSGQNRLLRILVNPRRAPGCELIGSIGHELQHALEALSNPNVRTSFGLSSFFHRIGPEGPRRFETPEAIQVGLTVEKEAC